MQAKARSTSGKAATTILALLLCAGSLSAAIFPDQIGNFTKGAPKALAIPDQELYNEYGLVATEQAEYAAPTTGASTGAPGTTGQGKPAHFTATAWRFHDSTGAMAVFQARRPSGATPAKVAELASQTSDGVILAFGNYVFQFTGSVPAAEELEDLYNHLPELEQAPLPALPGFLPKDGLIPNSERYVVGPVSLQRFEPRIPPSLAAFHLSAEAQLAKYRSPKGPMTLAIFEYPTPNMARDKTQEFQSIPGAVVKRAGPLLAVIIQPPDADAAERVLGPAALRSQVDRESEDSKGRE